jgi:hypothetical protein
MAGIDPLRYLNSDPLERHVLERVASRAHALAIDRDDQLSIRIRNQIGDLFSE